MKTNKINRFRTLFALLICAALCGCDKDPVNPMGPYVPEPEIPIEPGTVLYETNIAKDGIATSSSEQDGGKNGPAIAVDGVKETANEYFGSGQSTEMTDQWIMIKLKNEQEINNVTIWPKTNGTTVEMYPKAFRIETSMDGSNFETVLEKTNIPAPASSSGIEYWFPNKKAAYVRIVFTDLPYAQNEWTGWQKVYGVQLSEIEVYLFKEIPELPEEPDEPEFPEEAYDLNLAAGGSATTTNACLDGCGPERMIDGIVNDNSIGWSTKTDPSPYEANLTIKLIQKQKISEIRIWPKIGGSEEEMFVEGFPIDFTLEISADGEEWIPVVQKTDYTPQADVNTFSFEPTEARWVRLIATKLYIAPANMWVPVDSYVCQLNELEVYLRK